ncbi:MAG TPA: hypothetical protein VF027_04475 [Sphingomicrobium sp.]
MTRTPMLLLSLAAATALAGCNNSDHNVVAGPQTDDLNIAAESNLALPPSIVATKTYRCGDNSVIQVDWLSDNKTANIRMGEDSPVTQVVAPEPGKPMSGSGFTLTGSSSSGSITLERPEHGSQSCKA